MASISEQPSSRTILYSNSRTRLAGTRDATVQAMILLSVHGLVDDSSRVA